MRDARTHMVMQRREHRACPWKQEKRLGDLENMGTYGRLEFVLQQVTLRGSKYRTCSMHRVDLCIVVSNMRLATHSRSIQIVGFFVRVRRVCGGVLDCPRDRKREAREVSCPI